MDTTRTITPQLLEGWSVDLERSELKRFFAGTGITPLEFTRLPIEQNLEGDGSVPASKKKMYILTRPLVLPRDMLQKIALYSARLVLPIYEDIYPGDLRLQNALAKKELFDKGNIAQAMLDEAISSVRRTIWSYLEDSDDRPDPATLDESARLAAEAVSMTVLRAIENGFEKGAPWSAVRAACLSSAAQNSTSENWVKTQRETWDRIYFYTCELLEGEYAERNEGI